MFTVFLISFFLMLYTSESSQQSLLLATDSGIKTLSLSTSLETTLYKQAAKAVDFRYKSKDVYFISNLSNQIFYSYYSDFSEILSDPIPRVTSQSDISSLAVDWVSYRLYYGSPSAGTLLKETLRVSDPQMIASQVFELEHFALDPYERLIFFNVQGYLFSVTLEDTLVNRHDLKNSGLSDLSQLALDLHAKEVYVVCRREADDQWVLGVRDYDRSAETRTVYVGEELQGARALTVYQGRLVWASPCGDSHCLYSCQRDSCQFNVTIAWRTFEVINDVKFYTPLAQTPDRHAACLLCSHGCLEGSADCACPEGMEVDDDGVNCKDKPPTWDQRIWDLLDGLVSSLHQWFGSLLITTKPYWYPCGGLLLALVLCCICLLSTVPCSKPDLEVDDDLALGEMHHPHCPNRQARRAHHI